MTAIDRLSPDVIVPIYEFPTRPWLELAACRGMDPEIFHPARGASIEPAVRVCRSCPVREECLAWAIETGQKFGIWGGLSERARRKIRPRVRKTAAINHGTPGGYTAHRRRKEEPCELCRQAHNAYHAANQARIRAEKKAG